jgi:type I restriction enzyme R subunit
MAFLSEAAVERALLDQLHTLGYRIEREEDIGPDGRRPERESYGEVILRHRFEDVVTRLNPALPQAADSGTVQYQRAAGHIRWHCSPGGITVG